MFRWCSFCQCYIGQREPFNDYSLTHGICSKCKASGNFSEPENIDSIKTIIDFFNDLKDKVEREEDLDPKWLVQKGKKLNLRPSDLLAGIIQPILYEIGKKYEEGKLHVYQEHLFSAFTNKLIDVLKLEFQLDEFKGSADVLLFLASEEYHEFGIKFLDVLFRQEGIHSQTLLPGLPTKEMYKLALKIRPKVICISVALPSHFESFKTSLTIFNEWPGHDKPLILVGGQGTKPDKLPVPFAQIHNDSIQSLLELISNTLKNKAA